MFGSAALEALIGLMFIYFVLSVTCSALVETIASLVALRARALYTAIAGLLSTGNDTSLVDPKKFFANPILAPLGGPKRLKISVFQGRATGIPSYIPADTFATALLDAISTWPGPKVPQQHRHRFWSLREKIEHDAESSSTPSDAGSVPLIKPTPGDGNAAKAELTTTVSSAGKAQASVTGPAKTETNSLQKALRIFVTRSLAEIPDDTPSADLVRLAHLRGQIEGWCNDTMDRASGWYKRRVHVLLMIIAFGLVFIMNIDTIGIVQRLSADKDTRGALLVAATQAVAEDAKPTSSSENNKQGDNSDRGTETKSGQGDSPETPGQAMTSPGASATINQEKLHQRVAELDHLAIPIGWKDHWPSGKGEWVTKVIGLLLTVLAISLGAPFWFDMLSKLVNLRNAGTKPLDTTSRSTVTESPSPVVPTAVPIHSPADGEQTPMPTALPDGYWIRSARSNDWLNFSIAPNIPDKGAALSRLALLTYNSEASVKVVLQTWGRTNPIPGQSNDGFTTFKTFLTAGGTQALAAEWDDFIVVAFRGTQSTEMSDIVDDACCQQVERADLGPGKVHIGFAASLDQRMAELDAYVLACMTAKPRSVFITGHSLGAALATLYAGHLTLGDFKESKCPKVWLATFGSPRVGDSAFAVALERAMDFDRASFAELVNEGKMTVTEINRLPGRLFRFVDHNDIVTRVPPRDNQFDHAGPTVYLREDGTIDVSMTEWRRFLNSVSDAVSSFRKFIGTSASDHSMERYLTVLENMGNPRQ